METLSYKTYYDAVLALKEILVKRKPSLNISHLVITPDIYTFFLEKELVTGAGAFDLEITNFNRIFLKTPAAANSLDRNGAVMLLKRIAEANKKQLKCFSKASGQTGFAKKLYETFCALSSCNISPDELNFGGYLKHKADDIKLLYNQFLKESEGRYTDISKRFSVLEDYFKNSGYLKNTHLYLVNYEAFNPALKRLLSEIEKLALSVTLFTVEGGEGYQTDTDIQITSAPDKFTQLKEAAKLIRRAVRVDKILPDDICIVDESADYESAKRILGEFDIPFYMDYKLNLKDTEPVRFISSIFAYCFEGKRREDAFLIVKNACSGIARSDAEIFECFVLERGINYTAFDSVFDTKGDPKLAAAENVRQALIKITAPFLKLYPKTSAKELAAAVKKILASQNVLDISALVSTYGGADITQAVEKINKVIAQFEELVGDSAESAVTLSDYLTEGFNSESISFVPNRSGSVKIGSADTFRGQRFELAIVLNFNEGVLPVYTTGAGLITDNDIDRMQEFKVFYEPKTEDRNSLSRKNLRDFLVTQKRLYLSYVDNETSKASYIYNRVAIENKIKEYSYADKRYKAELCEDAEFTADFIATGGNALELLLTNEIGHESSIYRAIKDNVDVDGYFTDLGDDTIKSPAALFFPSGTTSVSALQTYFLCPRMFLCQYGLRLKKRDDGSVTPIDIGNILHGIVEDFIKLNDFSDIPKSVKKHLLAQIEKNVSFGYKLNAKMLADIAAEAEKLCEIVVYQIESGDFVPMGTEISYGKDDGLKTIEFGFGENKVKLVGKIDRADKWGDYVRVIDYKTGKAKFSYSDLYYGKKIQLSIYQQIYILNGYKPAGFFYLPLVYNWRDNEFSHRFSGVFNDDENVMIAFDNKLKNEMTTSDIIDAKTVTLKSGVVKFKTKNTAATATELIGLCAYAEKVASGAVNEILDGYLQPAPCDENGRTPCAFCDYASFCGDDNRKYRLLKPAGKPEILGGEDNGI